MKQKGFTLVEILITLTVLSILLMGVVGMASSFVINAKLRSTVDEFKTGLSTAKIEAIKRNASIIFTPNSDGGWEIAIASSFTTSGSIEKLQSKAMSSSNLTVTAVDGAGTTLTTATSKFRFTGSGRPSSDTSTEVPTPPQYPITFKFTATGKTCGSDSGITCLNVTLTSGGQLKTCNPEAASTSIYGCS